MYYIILFLKGLIVFGIAMGVSAISDKVLYADINFHDEIKGGNIAVSIFAGIMRASIILALSILMQ